MVCIKYLKFLNENAMEEISHGTVLLAPQLYLETDNGDAEQLFENVDMTCFRLPTWTYDLVVTTEPHHTSGSVCRHGTELIML
jgi:hypothetical protein